MTKAFVIVQHTDYDREEYKSNVAIRLTDDEQSVIDEVKKLNASLIESHHGETYYSYAQMPLTGYGGRFNFEFTDEELQIVSFKNRLWFETARLKNLYTAHNISVVKNMSFKAYFFDNIKWQGNLSKDKAEIIFDDFINQYGIINLSDYNPDFILN